MAWPLSRLTNWVANNVPVIGAAALNSMQDWVIALSSGTVSLLSLVVDGTGGTAVASPVPGTVSVSGTISTSGTKDGVLYRELCAFATIITAPNGAGNVSVGRNVITTNCKTATGTYVFRTKGAPSWLTSATADNTVIQLPNATTCDKGVLVSFTKQGGSTPVVEVTVLTDDGNSDRQFSLILFP